MNTCPPIRSGLQIVTVDYGRTLEEMIVAGGYESKTVDIDLKRFPFNREGVVEFETRIFHFNREISSEAALESIRTADPANPWQPATVEQLLAYVAQKDEEERRHPIVGLGFIGETIGHRRVACLRRNVSRRFLYFLWWVFDWGDDCRFLAVRKPSSPTSDR